METSTLLIAEAGSLAKDGTAFVLNHYVAIFLFFCTSATIFSPLVVVAWASTSQIVGDWIAAAPLFLRYFFRAAAHESRWALEDLLEPLPLASVSAALPDLWARDADKLVPTGGVPTRYGMSDVLEVLAGFVVLTLFWSEGKLATFSKLPGAIYVVATLRVLIWSLSYAVHPDSVELLRPLAVSVAGYLAWVFSELGYYLFTKIGLESLLMFSVSSAGFYVFLRSALARQQSIEQERAEEATSAQAGNVQTTPSAPTVEDVLEDLPAQNPATSATASLVSISKRPEPSGVTPSDRQPTMPPQPPSREVSHPQAISTGARIPRGSAFPQPASPGSPQSSPTHPTYKWCLAARRPKRMRRRGPCPVKPPTLNRTNRAEARRRKEDPSPLRRTFCPPTPPPPGSQTDTWASNIPPPSSPLRSSFFPQTPPGPKLEAKPLQEAVVLGSYSYQASKGQTRRAAKRPRSERENCPRWGTVTESLVSSSRFPGTAPKSAMQALDRYINTEYSAGPHMFAMVNEHEEWMHKGCWTMETRDIFELAKVTTDIYEEAKRMRRQATDGIPNVVNFNDKALSARWAAWIPKKLDFISKGLAACDGVGIFSEHECNKYPVWFEHCEKYCRLALEELVAVQTHFNGQGNQMNSVSRQQWRNGYHQASTGASSIIERLGELERQVANQGK